ncbi:MAG: hypothetical protein ACXAC2_11660 [Candidatus Kariarchaeaceae archaeon]|jgi:hypothetical protein
MLNFIETFSETLDTNIRMASLGYETEALRGFYSERTKLILFPSSLQLVMYGIASITLLFLYLYFKTKIRQKEKLNPPRSFKLLQNMIFSLTMILFCWIIIFYILQDRTWWPDIYTGGVTKLEPLQFIVLMFDLLVTFSIIFIILCIYQIRKFNIKHFIDILPTIASLNLFYQLLLSYFMKLDVHISHTRTETYFSALLQVQVFVVILVEISLVLILGIIVKSIREVQLNRVSETPQYEFSMQLNSQTSIEEKSKLVAIVIFVVIGVYSYFHPYILSAALHDRHVLSSFISPVSTQITPVLLIFGIFISFLSYMLSKRFFLSLKKRSMIKDGSKRI